MHESEFRNPPATIDLQSQRVTRIVTVRAPIDVVWAALTQPEHQAQWLGDIAVFPDGVGAGAKGRFAWTGEVVLAAQVVTCTARESFVFDWSEGILSSDSTRVAFTLSEAPEGTTIHFEEAGFDLAGDEGKVRGALRTLAQGWQLELDELIAHAESMTRD